jgi:hypothetical protein
MTMPHKKGHTGRARGAGGKFKKSKKRRRRS